MQEIKPWLRLNMTSLLPAQLHTLIRSLGSPSEVLKAPYRVIKECLKIKDSRAKEFVDEIGRVDVDRELEEIRRRGIKIITYEDPTYPACLKTIFDPPLVLYTLGEPLTQEGRFIAIVGSRQATLYGKLVAHSLARDLARYGGTVISGMARGVDTAAHRGALEGGGRTIAVLGCGVDVVYPKENLSLMREIVKSGTIVSEFPLGTKPLRQNFPRRNRIIAGLSMGVVVIEATLRSGALITANYALENGREVFAVPGRVDTRLSEGTNNLIKQGAKMVTNIQDILEEFPDVFTLKDESADGKDTPKELNLDEILVLRHLNSQPRHIEVITRELKIPLPRVITALMGLEMKGLVRQLRGKMFVKVNHLPI